MERQAAQPSMQFKTLTELYLADKKEHNKQITYETKKSRIDRWILPYFAARPVDTISAADIRKWQGDLKNAVNQNVCQAHDKKINSFLPIYVAFLYFQENDTLQEKGNLPAFSDISHILHALSQELVYE